MISLFSITQCVFISFTTIIKSFSFLFIIHSENLLIYNPSYVIDREQHARVRRTRSQQTRKQTSIKSPDAAFFVQRPHGIPVPFEPSLGWVQLIRHHRGFNHIDRVEERPIENPAQTSGEANLPRCSLSRLHFSPRTSSSCFQTPQNIPNPRVNFSPTSPPSHTTDLLTHVFHGILHARSHRLRHKTRIRFRRKICCCD